MIFPPFEQHRVHLIVYTEIQIAPQLRLHCLINASILISWRSSQVRFQAQVGRIIRCCTGFWDRNYFGNFPNIWEGIILNAMFLCVIKLYRYFFVIYFRSYAWLPSLPGSLWGLNLQLVDIIICGVRYISWFRWFYGSYCFSFTCLYFELVSKIVAVMSTFS